MNIKSMRIRSYRSFKVDEHVPAEAAELKPLREVMLLWAQRVAKRRINPDLGITDMAEVDRLHESDELEPFFAARARAWRNKYRDEGRAQGIERGFKQGIEQGIEQGVKRGLAGERELLCRQAARKFGADTASRLAAPLAGIDDAARLAEVGEWIIDCATGDRLIARFGDSA